MQIDVEALRARDRYALLTSVVVPRPIAWITTRSAAGVTNLAPFSYFNGVGSDPMMISTAIGQRRDGTPKDTLRNAQETGVYCVHLVELPQAEAMNASSAGYEPEVSEIDELGLPTEPCVAIAGVRLADARVALECKLVDVHEYGRKAKIHLLIGEVVLAHVADEILVAGDGPPVVDPHQISPVGRLGGGFYSRAGELFELTRP